MKEPPEKDNGRYYTPIQLADLIASLTIHNRNTKVLDPAFGQGALLLAVRAQLKNLGQENPNELLFGYDIQPLCKEYQKTHFTGLLNEQNLAERDFFTFDDKYDRNTFDIILMNPPYVRHHKLETFQLDNLRKMIGENVHLSKMSDFWAYFIIYSLKFIRKTGTLAAILPWSFIQADYARSVRRMLYDQFETLNVILIGKQIFEKTQERVLIFYGENFGASTKKVNLYYSFDVPTGKIQYNKISKKAWIDNPLKQLSQGDTQKILNKIADLVNFQPLEDFAQIKIGTVTGANWFFILDENAVQTIKPLKKMLRPIIKRANDLKSLNIDNNQNYDNFLLLIPPGSKISGTLKDYIEMGQSKNLHMGYHTRKRNPWYSITEPIPSDGFMPYMSKEIPFISLNRAGLLSTNSVHQVFFKNTDTNIQKWIQFSMFSSISQLSIELCGKTYGGGVLKIEPSSAKKILVFSGNNMAFPEELGKNVNEFLYRGNKRDAVEFVDNWFLNNLNIPKKDMEIVKKKYEYIRDIRLNIRLKST